MTERKFYTVLNKKVGTGVKLSKYGVRHAFLMKRTNGRDFTKKELWMPYFADLTPVRTFFIQNCAELSCGHFDTQPATFRQEMAEIPSSIRFGE